MNAIKAVITRGWAAILIAALAMAGYFLDWPIEAFIASIASVLIIFIALLAVGAREKMLDESAESLKELSGYFYRRFMGESSLSIFAIINSLYRTDNTKLWEWARSCDNAQRVFNTWCDSFNTRQETDHRTRRYSAYLRVSAKELWIMVNMYQEYIEQFAEIANRMDVPIESLEQYQKFGVEYNTFVHQFRDLIAALRRVARIEIEPPSIKLAPEISRIK
ncbi:MAG: hypothetical protein WC231_06155 [Dehalococcoidales bacterium]|jgi:hypothetical protein|nr:hypothetical protein [Dehalococcoidales bacterium]MDD5605169.1 hypothetical protein [Dehalococcoidales bacterium]MDX9986878.1 hypothetical protein [Dehalococcoidales bacterium]NLE89319.1 hypothetical protein [Dehalococcoidales bacterium]